MDELESEERPVSRVRKGINWIGTGMPRELKDAFYGSATRPFSAKRIKELYNIGGHKHSMALESVESDTRQDLMKELEDRGLTREEARQTVTDLIKAGILVETYDRDLRQKVLVLRGG